MMCANCVLAIAIAVDEVVLNAAGESGVSYAWRWITIVIVPVMALTIVLQRLSEARRFRAIAVDAGRSPTSSAMYFDNGVLSPHVTEGPVKLYLDLVSRSVANLIYEDRPAWLLKAGRQYQIGETFDLPSRLSGRDQPTEALSMIGWKRLKQLQACTEQVVIEGIPGDFIELGVMRGGAAVLMRAVLKAHGCTDRRVFACDTFDYIPPALSTANSWWLSAVSRVLSAIPIKSWRRHLTKSIFSQFQKSFPASQNPCDEIVDITMWFMQHPETVPQLRGTSEAHVRSHFARFGLLDEQTVLLKGFFADTIPSAPITKLSVIRCDADTYESTSDALRLTYDKLSPGGYCIIDDYGFFTECQRAVDEFRAANKITEPIETIDEFGVFWRKTL